MITVDSIHTRAGGWGKAASRLTNVTFTWERGVLAILGTPADGTTALLEVLAGNLRVRAGRATVDGREPSAARSRVAYAPLEVSLPESLRVDEVCSLAGQIRGEKPMTAAARLAPLGLESLERRYVRSLALGESRAVALAIAITSGAPVLLVDEPLARLDPAPAGRVIAALRARAAAGATVVVTTASVREATRLADQLGVLTRGVFTHLPPSQAHVGHAGARLVVILAASSPSAVSSFVGALAGEEAIATVELARFATAEPVARAGGSPTPPGAVAVVVGGPDLLAVARAVARGASRTGAAVEAIESAVIPLDAIRSGLALPRPGLLPSRPPPPSPPVGTPGDGP